MTKTKSGRKAFHPLAIHFLALVVLFGGSLFQPTSLGATQSSQPTTIILVRHAEKQIVPPENKDPNISPEGEARAKEIARMLSGSGIAAIYATQFKRTQQTVNPLAEQLRVAVTQIEAKKTADLVAQIRKANMGQTVLIAGHNNTVPEIIAALGGPQLPIIPETEFDNLYILTIQKDGVVKLLQMKYGSHLPVGGQSMTKP
jgi:broad specificity phosphatase PhoE